MLVGLTGGIACGKTAVAQMLAARGAMVIDADQVARQVVSKGSDGLAALVQTFGADILTAEDELDRKALGAMVFSGEANLEELNKIVHPLVATESMRQISEALSQDVSLVVYDAALLFEAGRAENFRPIIVVAASAENQKTRLMMRDGFSELEAQQRIEAQMPVQEKVALADFVVRNDGSLDQTEKQVDDLWAVLVKEPKR